MTIRLVVIGAGGRENHYARIFAEGILGEVVQAIGVSSGTCSRAMTDPDVAFISENVDAVIVTPPDSTHTPLSLACIAAGTPVLY